MVSLVGKTAHRLGQVHRRDVSMSDEPSATNVSILIVAYNAREFIERCLSSIPAACKGISYEVLLIDNGTDGTAELVRDKFANLKVIPSQGNVGYGQGNNIAASQASSSSELYVVLNPDTELHAEAISKLVIVARNNPGFGALAGAITEDDQADVVQPLVAIPDVWSLAFGIVGLGKYWAQARLPKADSADLFEMEALNGAFVAIRRTVWEALGGFDETFFLYCEDADISLRISQLGMKLGMVRSSKTRHDVGSGHSYSPVRQYYLFTGNAHFANKHFGTLKKTAYKTTLWLAALTRFLGATAMQGQNKKMKDMAKAYRDLALRPWKWFAGYDSRGADPRR